MADEFENGENVLEIIPEEVDEEGEDTNSGEGSSGRPMFLMEKGEQPSYIESINPNLPQTTKQYLLRSFGPFWATHFINPDAPPVRNFPSDAVNLSKIDSNDADVVWDLLRFNSLRKLQYQDFRMGPALRKSFGAYTRQVQHFDLEAKTPRNLKPLHRFYYWDSETGKDVPPEESFPSDQSSKIRVAKKRKVFGFAHASSSNNQNVSELLLFNNQPPRYSLEVEPNQSQFSGRLVRHADLTQEYRHMNTERSQASVYPKKRPATGNEINKLVFATERELVSRPTFAAKHKAASSRNKIFPLKPLNSPVDHSVIASQRMFSAPHDQIEDLIKDERFQRDNLRLLRRSSAPPKEKNGWNPLTLAEIVDTIDISAPASTRKKPLTAS